MKKRPPRRTVEHSYYASNACGLVAYQTRKQAKKIARRTNATTSPFRCDGCGLFHNGNLPEDVKAGRISREVMRSGRGHRRRGGTP